MVTHFPGISGCPLKSRKGEPLTRRQPEPLCEADALHWVVGKEFPPIDHQSHLMNPVLVPGVSGAPYICFGRFIAHPFFIFFFG